MSRTNQVRRIITAVVVLVVTSVAGYLQLLPRDVATEANVSGVVVSPTGAPVHGAKVFVFFNPYEDTRHLATGPGRAVTYADGSFTVFGLQFREYYLIAIHPDYCDSEGVGVRVTAQGINGVRVALLNGGQVEGTVDPSQGPVADRVVNLYSHRGSRGWRSATTDAQGRFKLDKVIAQDYTVELKPPGWGYYQTAEQVGPRRPIRVHVGQTTTVNFGKD